MLRNIFYDKKRSVMHHWMYGENGEDVYKKVHYKPYIYIPSVDPKFTEAYGIDSVPLARREFSSEWERNEFAQKFKGQKYFNLPASQQYLLENFYTKDVTQLTEKPLRTFFYDIEVIAGEFPDPKEAKFPITSITIYDTFTKKYYVWGVKVYNVYTIKDDLKGVEPEDVVYNFCLSETELLKKFLRFWRSNFPDLLVGYNSFSFDLPYIVHRIERVLGEGKSSNLSPVGYVHGHEKDNKFGQTYTEYTMGGVSHLDYMVLFKTFTPGERESDSLDYVCKDEIGIGKLDYGDTNLQDLSMTNWNRFVNYNIWDVKLLIMLEEKRKYLEIARFSAVSGYCNIDKALGKVAIITGIVAKQGMMNNQMITTQDDGDYEKIPGGYVKDPDIGIYENVIVMDLNSLYPNTIITLNISPETKVAKIANETPEVVSLYLFKSGKYVDVPREKFKPLIQKKNWCVSAAGVLFDQTKKGLCSQFVDDLYKKRKSVKSEMILIEQELTKMSMDDAEYSSKKRKADQMDTLQYLYKILLNSTYGVLANRFFALYDLDCAKSITLTGQALIKQSDKIANAYMRKEWNLDKKDRVIAEDTDSAILSIDDILKKVGSTIVDSKGDLTSEFVDIENKISKNLNEGAVAWAVENLNTSDCRFEFKRESACPKAIWVAKKHYILQIKNTEGIKITDEKKEFKYKGLSVVKSTFSENTKKITRSIVKGIFDSPDKKKADEFFFQSYDKFFNLSENDVSIRSTIKCLSKWDNHSKDFSTVSGCPRHVKWAIYHNRLIQLKNLENKYPLIQEGMKIKLAYVKPNVYNLAGIAYMDVLPPEFELVIDREQMFEKCVIKCLQPIFTALKWNVPDPKKQYEYSLEDLFG